MIPKQLLRLSKRSQPRRKSKGGRAIGEPHCTSARCHRHELGFSVACRGFKALKQQTKLLFLVLRRPHEALQTYTELLTYTKSAVTRNYSERSINGILDYVGDGGKKGKGRKAAEAAKGNEVDVEVLQRFYEVTKASMEDTRNDVCPNSESLW